MRNKYKRHEKLTEHNKNTTKLEKNNNFSSTYNIKKTKNPLIGNSVPDRVKPIFNRFNRLNNQKENKNQYIKEEEIKNHKELPTKKTNEFNEKETKTTNIYKYRPTGHLSSYISHNKINVNENKNINLNENKNIDNENKVKHLDNIKNICYKSNYINLGKIISYNAKIKNMCKKNEINNNINIKKGDNNYKINEEINTQNKDENMINTKIPNNNTEINNKGYTLKRKHNFSKLIDKIKQTNNLNQAIQTKNIMTTKEKEKSNINYNYNKEEENDNNSIKKDLKKHDNDKNGSNISPQKDKSNEAHIEMAKKDNEKKNDENSVKDNASESSSLMSSKLINWNIKPKQSFQFLVHQAYKNRELSNSFHKYYESNQFRSRRESRERSEKDENSVNTEEHSTEKHKFRNLSLLRTYKFNEGDSFSSLNTNVNNENRYNSLTDRKTENDMFNNNKINNIKILNLSFNKHHDDLNNYEHNDSHGHNSSVITNNIINNNVYNTTLNFYKISNISKSKINPGQRGKPLSTKNLLENDGIIYEDETFFKNDKINNNNLSNNTYNINNPKEYINYTVKSQSSNNSTYIVPSINLELLFSLEKRLQLLLDKINRYQNCDKECLDFILFFFDKHFYDEETKIFKNKHNKKNFLYNVRIEILCFFLCYDISNSKNFNQAAILLKTIFNIVHTNYLILISYVISLYQFNVNNIDNNNLEIINSLKKIIDQELKAHLTNQDMNEYNILQIITNNSKNINNYYKMLIDNLYGQNYIIDDNNIKFPQCLSNFNYIFSQNKYQNVLSVFFFDAYRLLTNYDFNDLYEFFNVFLNKKQNSDYITNNNNNNNNAKTTNEYCSTYNYVIPKNNKIEKYLLPKMKRYYKYSLVLDLDETLICIKRDSNNNIKLNKNNLIALIIRPGLIDFLQKMKKLYELILFSSGTSEYVSPIIKNIEKKEKFFEHILYRQHVTFDENGNFFKNLNLLNRNVKNILIVDDNYKNFKYHKSNGICIKPFYGDSYNDKNTLKILGNILYKIRYDADITGDIRISLNKEKNSIIYSQIANNF